MMTDVIDRKAAIDVLDRNRILGQGLLNDTLDYIADAIMALPTAQPERLTDDDFETIRIHLNAYKEKLCNQQRWEEADEYQRILDRFMSFASAQPDVPDTNVGDTISRQAAIDALDKRFDSIPMEQTTEILLLRKDLRELPSAQPEVIHCGECRYYKDVTSIHGDCECGEMWQSLFGEITEVEAINVHKDHYCGYAERKYESNK